MSNTLCEARGGGEGLQLECFMLGASNVSVILWQAFKIGADELPWVKLWLTEHVIAYGIISDVSQKESAGVIFPARLVEHHHFYFFRL